jgi:hypothetical protein
MMNIPSNAKIPAPRMARPSFSEDMVIGQGGFGWVFGGESVLSVAMLCSILRI